MGGLWVDGVEHTFAAPYSHVVLNGHSVYVSVNMIRVLTDN